MILPFSVIFMDAQIHSLEIEDFVKRVRYDIVFFPILLRHNLKIEVFPKKEPYDLVLLQNFTGCGNTLF